MAKRTLAERMADPENQVTKTQQHYKEQCDINRMILRHLGNQQPIPEVGPGIYGDFTNVGSYQEALDRVIAAKQEFMTLPASLRQRFKNDPGEFINFCSNPENQDELIDLGLADVPAEAPAPIDVNVVTPTQPDPSPGD